MRSFCLVLHTVAHLLTLHRVTPVATHRTPAFTRGFYLPHLVRYGSDFLPVPVPTLPFGWLPVGSVHTYRLPFTHAHYRLFTHTRLIHTVARSARYRGSGYCGLDFTYTHLPVYVCSWFGCAQFTFTRLPRCVCRVYHVAYRVWLRLRGCSLPLCGSLPYVPFTTIHALPRIPAQFIHTRLPPAYRAPPTATLRLPTCPLVLHIHTALGLRDTPSTSSTPRIPHLRAAVRAHACQLDYAVRTVTRLRYAFLPRRLRFIRSHCQHTTCYPFYVHCGSVARFARTHILRTRAFLVLPVRTCRSYDSVLPLPVGCSCLRLPPRTTYTCVSGSPCAHCRLHGSCLPSLHLHHATLCLPYARVLHGCGCTHCTRSTARLRLRIRSPFATQHLVYAHTPFCTHSLPGYSFTPHVRTARTDAAHARVHAPPTALYLDYVLQLVPATVRLYGLPRLPPFTWFLTCAYHHLLVQRSSPLRLLRGYAHVVRSVLHLPVLLRSLPLVRLRLRCLPAGSPHTHRVLPRGLPYHCACCGLVTVALRFWIITAVTFLVCVPHVYAPRVHAVLLHMVLRGYGWLPAVPLPGSRLYTVLLVRGLPAVWLVAFTFGLWFAPQFTFTTLPVHHIPVIRVLPFYRGYAWLFTRLPACIRAVLQFAFTAPTFTVTPFPFPVTVDCHVAFCLPCVLCLPATAILLHILRFTYYTLLGSPHCVTVTGSPFAVHRLLTPATICRLVVTTDILRWLRALPLRSAGLLPFLQLRFTLRLPLRRYHGLPHARYHVATTCRFCHTWITRFCPVWLPHTTIYAVLHHYRSSSCGYYWLPFTTAFGWYRSLRTFVTVLRGYTLLHTFARCVILRWLHVALHLRFACGAVGLPSSYAFYHPGSLPVTHHFSLLLPHTLVVTLVAGCRSTRVRLRLFCVLRSRFTRTRFATHSTRSYVPTWFTLRFARYVRIYAWFCRLPVPVTVLPVLHGWIAVYHWITTTCGWFCTPVPRSRLPGSAFVTTATLPLRYAPRFCGHYHWFARSVLRYCHVWILCTRSAGCVTFG